MGEPAPLQGPDLTAGVPTADVAEGTPLLGHAFGEAVIVVRRGAECFAVGATCTHYSGPLAEGLVVGETVRCPWHHACYSLRSGEPIGGPALNTLPCYDVEETDGQVRITAKRAPAPAPPRVTASDPVPASVIIVGAGGAGDSCAEELRRRGYEGPVTLIDPDPDVPVDRPNLSKDYLAGSAPAEWLALHPPEFYVERRITRRRVRVTALDTAAQRVTLDDGAALVYGALLIATGAEPMRLPFGGRGGPEIRYLRTVADSRAIIAAAGKAKRAVVIGASFIGLEVAASLRARGVAVHVAAPDDRPLGRILGTELGDFVRALHEEHGVVFHLGQGVKAVGAEGVTLADGTVLAADLVVAGIGVKPNVALAEQAGLTLDRGIVVDAYLRTSARNVWAAGDVARYPDPRTGESVRIEHWVVSQRQGRTAARNMLGLREPYRDVPFFWSQHYDVSINYVGHAEKWDAVDVDGDPMTRDCTVRYVRGGRTLAAATIFRDKASLEIEAAMEGEGAGVPA